MFSHTIPEDSHDNCFLYQLQDFVPVHGRNTSMPYVWIMRVTREIAMAEEMGLSTERMSRSTREHMPERLLLRGRSIEYMMSRKTPGTCHLTSR